MEDKKTKYEKLDIPKEVKIGKFTYTFKKELKEDKLSYRCINRKCPVLIIISKSELNKIKKKIMMVK